MVKRCDRCDMIIEDDDGLYCESFNLIIEDQPKEPKKGETGEEVISTFIKVICIACRNGLAMEFGEDLRGYKV